MILLHLHIGGVALIGPVSDWDDEGLPELEADRPADCPELDVDRPSTNQ